MFYVGANKMYGTIYHVSPEEVKHMDMLNNSFARLGIIFHYRVRMNSHLHKNTTLTL